MALETTPAGLAHAGRLPLIGCAGWSLPREFWPQFAADGTHLQRYASRFAAVEINSSFYRPHRPATYARWAASVPASFRFAAKLPRRITHELRLRQSEAALSIFLAEVTALQSQLGCLLVQLAAKPGLRSCRRRGVFRQPAPPVQRRRRLRASSRQLVRASRPGAPDGLPDRPRGRRPGPGPCGGRSRRLGWAGLLSLARLAENVLLGLQPRRPRARVPATGCGGPIRQAGLVDLRQHRRGCGDQQRPGSAG